MNPPKFNYHDLLALESSVVREDTIEYGFIGTLQKLKYEYRPDINNGTIWSTTGNGKTLISFMASDQYSERMNVGYSLN